MNVPLRANRTHGVIGHTIAAGRMIVIVLAAAICAVAVRSHAQASPEPNPVERGVKQATAPHGPFVIRHARIFDGRQVVSADSIFVQNGKIEAVGKNLRVPADTTEIDATGDTVLPGLIDSHTHDWENSPKQALLFGVTTELNMAGIPAIVNKLKEAGTTDFDSAEMFSAGNVVTPPKGHGTEFGVPVPTLSSASEAQQFVGDRIAEGSDYIKII